MNVKYKINPDIFCISPLGRNFVIYSKINNRGRKEAELLFAINIDSLKNQNILQNED